MSAAQSRPRFRQPCQPARHEQSARPRRRAEEACDHAPVLRRVGRPRASGGVGAGAMRRNEIIRIRDGFLVDARGELRAIAEQPSAVSGARAPRSADAEAAERARRRRARAWRRSQLSRMRATRYRATRSRSASPRPFRKSGRSGRDVGASAILTGGGMAYAKRTRRWRRGARRRLGSPFEPFALN